MSAGLKSFVRIAAWGQLDAQMPHWMHVARFQRGTFGAKPRFSRAAVPVGRVPSRLIAETGIASPLLRIEGSMIFFAKSLASSGISFSIGAQGTPSRLAGIFTWTHASAAASTSSLFMSTTAWPFLAKVLALSAFISFAASSKGTMPETLK